MGQHLMPEGAAPSTPATGYVAVYAKADGLLYSKDDAGVETPLGGGTATGTNTGDQIASTVPNTPAGNIVATTVQAAINELDTEKLSPANIGVTVQAYDADLTTWAGVTPGTGVATALTVNVGAVGSPVVNGGALGTPSSGTLTNCTKDGVHEIGYLEVPQNTQSAAYTLVLADAGKHIFHPSADTTARTWTIPANSSVAYPIGTAITFTNQNAAGVITIAITTDTMRLAGAGTTGNRTLAANGVATALKITATEWIISGTGLT